MNISSNVSFGTKVVIEKSEKTDKALKSLGLENVRELRKAADELSNLKYYPADDTFEISGKLEPGKSEGAPLLNFNLGDQNDSFDIDKLLKTLSKQGLDLSTFVVAKYNQMLNNGPINTSPIKLSLIESLFTDFPKDK